MGFTRDDLRRGRPWRGGQPRRASPRPRLGFEVLESRWLLSQGGSDFLRTPAGLSGPATGVGWSWPSPPRPAAAAPSAPPPTVSWPATGGSGGADLGPGGSSNAMGTASPSLTPIAPSYGPAGQIFLQIGSRASLVLVGPVPAPNEPGLAPAALAAAEPMPEGPSSQMAGRLSPNNPSDLYRISLDPGTVSLWMNLTMSLPPGVSWGRMRVFDAAGRPLADWQFTNQISCQFFPGSQSNGKASDPAVFVQISMGPIAAGFAPGAAVYQFQVVRPIVPPALGPALAGSLLTPLPPVSGSTPMITSSASLAPSPTEGGEPLQAQGLGPVTTGPGVGVGQAVLGPMPTRAAGPSGGPPSEGEPTPPIGRFAGAIIDLDLVPAWPARVRAQSEPMARNADPTANPSDRAPSALVALRGPGGFPLLGAALIAERPMPRLGEGEALPLVSAPLGGAGGWHCGPSPAQPGPGPRGPLSNLARGASPVARRGPALLSMNLVALLAFGLLLPDLVAALQGFTPRRPLPRGLHLALGRARMEDSDPTALQP